MAMGYRDSIYSRMAACSGRRLHPAWIYLLCVLASISIAAPVPARAIPPTQFAPTLAALRVALQASGSAILVTDPPGSRLHTSSHTGLRPPTGTPSLSPLLHSTRRIFLEDIPPPSSEVLKIAWFQLPTKPSALPGPASPTLRNSSISASNRQRAP